MPVCPKCRLDNPESAVMCDCGHPFDEKGAAAARASGFVPYNESHPPGPRTAVKLRAGALGYLVGFLPVFWTAFQSDVVGLIVMSALAILTGFVGAFVALRILKVRHAAAGRRDRNRVKAA